MKTAFGFYLVLVACMLGFFGSVGEAKAQFTDCSAITGMPQSECQALVDLYDSTNGANWTTKTGWKQTTTPCSWFRVTCSGGHVSQLQPYTNNLVGPIPASIGNLTNLTLLNLGGNQLSGNIPTEIANLTNLTALQLHQNQLSGSIPTEIGSLTQLTTLVLFTNQLSGSIPSSIGNLINLLNLRLEDNLLSGSIPPEMGNLTNLTTTLHLAANQLSGSIPPEIGNLTKLTSLYLNSNQLSGSIPTSIGNLVNLADLRLNSNQLSGSIPSEVGNLTKLTTLYLYSNQLSGSIPSEIGNLSMLTSLRLDYNQLSGEIPKEIGNLVNLTTLYLFMNQLNGSIPTEIGNLTKLTTLSLYNNQLSGSIPAEIGNLTKLTNIQLNGNQLSGNIPASIGNLVNLSSLYLYNNQLSGSIPAEIGNLTKLTVLSIYDNQLSGNIPAEIVNMPELQVIHLYQNKLEGSIPSDIGNLTKLTNLYLQDNNLSGEIPASIGNLVNLAGLTLQRNYLVGSIPHQLGNLSNLSLLYLYSNYLTGTIPDSICNLRKLIALKLQDNLLSGSIPTNIGNMSNLEIMYLDKNQLSGNIPETIGNLTNLYELYLNQNQLTGFLPTSLTDLPHLADLYIDNNMLSGEIPQNLLLKNSLRNFQYHNNHFLVSVKGRIINSGNSGIEGVTINVTGPYTTSATTAADGTFTVKIPDQSSYTLTPVKTGYEFSPNVLTGSLDIEIIGGLELTDHDFTADTSRHTISGTATAGGSPLAGVTVIGSGTLGSQTTDASGHYSFSGVLYGTSYTLTPSKTGYTISPTSVGGTVTENVTYDLTATLNDADGDGLSDLDEATHGTNPNKADTDGDGVSDSEEIANGTNPLDKGSAEVTRPATLCSEWNGYLGMYNALEHVNLATNGRKYTTTLYSLAGDAEAPVKFSIAGGGEYDLLVHELNGFENDRYGKVCTTVTNGSPGELDGRMVFYKPDAASGGYQFAFAMPLGNGLSGTQYVPYNTYQPSLDPVDAGNLAANWIQITNLSTSKQTGNLVFYDRDGTEIARQEVALKAGARFDFSGHDLAGRSQVGLVEWIPTASTARFQLRNVRYYYRADGVNVPLGDDFDSAFQLEGIVGSGQLLTVPLDTENSSSVLELANTLNEEVKAEVTIYAATGGEALHHQTYKLAPHATFHLIADMILNGGQGIATIQGNQVESIIATAMQYGRTDTLGIQTVYGIQASEARGTVMHGSYNTFLKQDCRLLMVNPTSAEAIASVSLKRYDGTIVNLRQDLPVPAHGLTDYDLCAQDQENVYGVVTVQPATPNTIFATVLRIGESEQYRFPTPVRD